jgi:hypothetical protein
MKTLGGNMAQENHDHDLHSTDWEAERDPLDRELDAALAKYSAAEPRAGLEGRVLAHLQAQREHVSTGSWLRWSFVSAALALGAILLAVGLAWRIDRAPKPATASRSTTTSPAIARSGQPNAREEAGLNGKEKNDLAQSFRSVKKNVTHRARPIAIANAHPKLDQFPSPQALSEQEKILASYVEKYPERAGLLARARTEELRQDQLEEMQVFLSSGWSSDSEGTAGDRTQR